MEKKLLDTNTRESNIELLRIVLMIMVITHHLILKVDSEGDCNKTTLLMALDSFAIIAVNCFVFISGYYGIKFKIKTLISFVLQGVFYSVGIYVLYNVILSPQNFSLIDLGKRFFPLTFAVWWFLSAFIGVYLLSPFINKGIEILKQYQAGGIILILSYLFCSYPLTGNNVYSGGGHEFFTLLLVYMIARYCGKYIKDIKKAIPLHICIFLLTFIIVMACKISGNGYLVWLVIAYNCPLIILGAIFFFYSFKKIKLKNKIINKIAPLTFGIYLIHETPENRASIKECMTQINAAIQNPLLLGITMIAIAICIFAVCAGIEKVRQIICNPIVDFIDKKASILIDQFKSITG